MPEHRDVWKAEAPGTIAAELPRGARPLPVPIDRHLTPDTPDLELVLPARAENVAVVRHAFGGLGDVLDVGDQTLSDIKLAVTEACTNVVVHAYPEGDGPLDVRAILDERRLTVVVADQGRGILPRADSPGLGLGLPLIATLAESLELGTGIEDETEVRMTFNLDGSGGEGPFPRR